MPEEPCEEDGQYDENYQCIHKGASCENNGKYNDNFQCVHTGDKCEKNGKYNSSLVCVHSGESCTKSGKTGKYDANANCYVQGDSCTINGESGKYGSYFTCIPNGYDGYIPSIGNIKKLSGTYTWNEAFSACKAKGMHLPTMSELETIYAQKGKVDGVPTSGWFWSSSSFSSDTACARYFNWASSYDDSRDTNNSFLCVGN